MSNDRARGVDNLRGCGCGCLEYAGLKLQSWIVAGGRPTAAIAGAVALAIMPLLSSRLHSGTGQLPGASTYHSVVVLNVRHARLIRYPALAQLLWSGNTSIAKATSIGRCYFFGDQP